jgi:hypothetical protein
LNIPIKGKLQEVEEQNQFLISKMQEYEEAYQEGRIMSKEYKKRMDGQNKRLSQLEARFNELTAHFDTDRKLDREFELEQDTAKKIDKHDKMLAAKRQTIRKQYELENTVRDSK